jgi:hypothetical protein
MREGRTITFWPLRQILHKEWARCTEDMQVRTTIISYGLLLFSATIYKPSRRSGQDEKKNRHTVHNMLIPFFSELLKICLKEWATCEDNNHLLASSSHSVTVYKPSTRRGQDGEKNR